MSPCIALASECGGIADEFAAANGGQQIGTDAPWTDLSEWDAFEQFIVCDREAILAMAKSLRAEGHRVRISELVLKAGLGPRKMVNPPPNVEVWKHAHDSRNRKESDQQGTHLDSRPVPEWMAWQQFYTGFLDQEVGSPAIFESFLVERAGFTPDEAGLVRADGLRYLDELGRLDEDMLKGLVERFPPDFEASITLAKALEREIGLTASEFLPYRAPNGNRIMDVLDSEGFFELDEARRKLAFRSHWELVAENIGLYKLLWIEEHIMQSVRPKIHRGTRTRLVSLKRYPLPQEPMKQE